MQNAKIEAITKQLNCNKGASTINEVWETLPSSCENLPRNIIADILNACEKSFHAGEKAKEREIKNELGHDWWK
ncbi:MAG: hypothetical protein RR454_00370 [Clostridia bacterium]